MIGRARAWMLATVIGVVIAGLTAVAYGRAQPQRSERPTDSPEMKPAPVVTVGHGGIRFDAGRCVRTIYSYDYDLGSVCVTVQGVKDDACVFEYMFEIEGGYTVHLCQVPRSAGEVSVRWTWKPNPDGLGGHEHMATSFATERCEVVKTGNVFEDLDKELQR